MLKGLILLARLSSEHVSFPGRVCLSVSSGTTCDEDLISFSLFASLPPPQRFSIHSAALLLNQTKVTVETNDIEKYCSHRSCKSLGPNLSSSVCSRPCLMSSGSYRFSDQPLLEAFRNEMPARGPYFPKSQHTVRALATFDGTRQCQNRKGTHFRTSSQ